MTASVFNIGWAEVEITPARPVSVSGSFTLRVSEGVADPLFATAWALETGGEQAVFASCDIVTIPDDLRDAVRSKLAGRQTGLDPMKVILNATHTHHAPELHTRVSIIGHTSAVGNGVELHEISPDIMSVEEYAEYAADRIVEAIVQAWQARAPGGIAYGLSYAVVGRNRRWVDRDGHATMHGLNAAAADRFRYIEGYEDHSLNLMATYDAAGKLTGVILNFACTAQTPGNTQPDRISADFWCEIRSELRLRFGSDLFILAQCSFAGDQTAYEQFDKPAEDRMRRLKGWTKRQEIAHSVAKAVEELLPVIRKEIDTTPHMRHQAATIPLIANRLTEADVRAAELEADKRLAQFESEKRKLAAHPELRETPYWYRELTNATRHEQWARNVRARYELQKINPTLAVEVHVLRLGDVIFASVPFEYYLDYGVQVKVRSPAVQTFLLQLAGDGTYVPSPRSLAGGGYGSIAASNPVGHEGGQQLADYLVSTMRSIWQ